MAVMHIRGSGMTIEDRTREDDSVSSLKEKTEIVFPNGENLTVVLADLSQNEIDELRLRIAFWEKSGLLERKAKGTLSGQSLKDTRARYGAPKEWDHLQLSFDRNESDSLTGEQLEQTRRAMLDVAGRDITGTHRKMTISRIHTDTGNSHVDVFVHRHAYNAAENAALPADELTGPSRLASVMEQINKRLRVLSLPPMADVRKQDGRSLYEETATSDKAKDALNEFVQDAGGIPTQRTGAPSGAGSGNVPTPIPRIADPDAASLERLVRDAERDAKSAAQRLVDAQNALEAQRQRTELRARVERLEMEVAERDAAIATRDRLIESERLATAEALAASQAQRDEVQQQLEQTQGQLEEMGGRFTQAAQERDEAHQRITGLEADYANSQEEIGQQQGVIVTLQADLAGATTERDSERTARAAAEVQRDQAQQLAADQTARADQAEAARNALQQQFESERTARATAEAARDRAQQGAVQAQRAATASTAASAEMLKNEKAERAQERGLFEQLKAGMADTINALKEQLLSIKDQLMRVTTDRDTEVQRLVEREKTKDAELQHLRQRVADLEGGDNDGGGQAAPRGFKPPGKR